MTLVLDAGALLRIERRDPAIGALLERARRRGTGVGTTAPVVAQVLRDPARQANLSRVLRGLEVAAFGREDVGEVGRLLAAAGTADVVDAHLALLVRDGDVVLTSDPDDLRVFADARGVRPRIERV